MNSHFTVVYDACVLCPAPLRDFLMRLTLTDLFRARWSDIIHNAWIRNVLAQRPDLKQEALESTRSLMNAHVRDCLVTGFEHLISYVELPDLDDRQPAPVAAEPAQNGRRVPRHLVKARSHADGRPAARMEGGDLIDAGSMPVSGIKPTPWKADEVESHFWRPVSVKTCLKVRGFSLSISAFRRNPQGFATCPNAGIAYFQ